MADFVGIIDQGTTSTRFMLKVDGGVTANSLAMPLQADVWRPGEPPGDRRDHRAGGHTGWRKAGQRTLDWVEVG